MLDKTLSEKFPFLSGLSYQDKEYVGIILNSDDKIISFYDFERIKNPQQKKEFLELGDVWFFESNRCLPISIFLGEEMTKFKYCIKTVPRKDAELLFGPCTSLGNILKKRIKRRQITLIPRDKR